MKGRSFPALQMRVHEWHTQLAREAKSASKRWPASGIEAYQEARESGAEGKTGTWTIQELLDGKALYEEGRVMRHCVYTYVRDCLSGGTSIWSLRWIREGEEARPRRLLTIEVNNARRAVVQVRGHCNQTLGADRGNAGMKTAEAVLRRWAGEQRLSLAFRR